MRGKRTLLLPSISILRITPAHAGKTLAAKTKSVLSRDHPRACGENNLLGFLRLKFVGSPPRMRGKRIQNIFPLNDTGITPAHAGKTREGWLHGIW